MDPRQLSALRRNVLGGLALAGLGVLLGGCAMLRGDDQKVVFTAKLTGAGEVPPLTTAAVGRVDAVLDTDTRLLRWKATLNGLSGVPTGAHFHGPATAGQNAGVALGWPAPLSIRYEGSATLSTAQMADLMAERWYVNVHTAAHPGGEIRGQMTTVRP